MESKEKIFVEPNHNEMYLCFMTEWMNYCEQKKRELQQNIINWFKFIVSLDIGLHPVKVDYTTNEKTYKTIATWKYEVIDEKKWTLARIKYGI